MQFKFTIFFSIGQSQSDKKMSVPENKSLQKQMNARMASGKNRFSSETPLIFVKQSANSALEGKESNAVPKKKPVLFKRALTSVYSASVSQDLQDIETMNKELSSDHMEAKRFVCSLESCDWSFSTAYKLKRHKESHKGHKDFACSTEGCNRRFTTVYNLKTHMKLHELPCTEVCPQPNCSETFRNKRLLDQHMKIHSNGNREYRCPYPGCTRWFFSQTSIGSHSRIHQHDSELVCAFDGCGRKFDKLCRLKQHMRSHTGERPYQCTVEGCSWAFFTSSKLCRHLQMHSGQKKWRCPFDDCGKLFTRAEHVKGHLVTHTSLRPFSCTADGCDARFKSKNSLDIHLKRHNQMDNKAKRVVFDCPFEECAQNFSNKAQMKAHLDKQGERMESSQQSGSVTVSTPVEFLPMMISLELDSLNDAQNKRASSVTCVDHSLFLGQPAAAVVCSKTSTLNLLTVPVLMSSKPNVINSSSSSCSAASDTAALSKYQHSLHKQITQNVMLNMNEIMTSHAITFRDPETGTIYVQTQLLQDDPPNTGMYLNDENNDNLATTNEPPMIAAELTGMLHEFDSEDSHKVSFTGTTINLQDLE